MSDISSDPVDVNRCPACGDFLDEYHGRKPCRDISSVTGSGWDGWPERGAASREFRQRVEAMTRQVLIEKPKWSGSMCMTEAERRVLAAIQRDAVAPYKEALNDLMALVRAEDAFGRAWNRAVELTDE